MLYIMQVADNIPTLKQYHIKTIIIIQTRVNILVCSPQDKILGIIPAIAWCTSSSKEGYGEWHCMQGVGTTEQVVCKCLVASGQPYACMELLRQ